MILRTTDGGITWNLVNWAPEEENPLLDVWFSDADNGFAIGAYGSFFRTSDSGETWTSEPISEWDFHLHHLARSANGRLYMAAEAGMIYRSDDGGTTWTELPSPYEGSFFGTLPLDGDTVLVFGLQGHLFRSEDAGESWTPVETGTTAMLTDGIRLADGTIVISGLGGTLLTLVRRRIDLRAATAAGSTRDLGHRRGWPGSIAAGWRIRGQDDRERNPDAMITRLENLIFGRRRLVVVFFLLMTVFMAYQASNLRIDAGFAKLLPLEHEYMQTYVEYRDAFGGANRVVIAIRARDGDIFTPKFFEVLQEVTDDVFFIPGVDRTRVMSLFTPNVRFTEVVEDGISGGNVIPDDFEPNDQGLAKVRENLLKSVYMGRLVANDFSSALVVASLLEVDPTTGDASRLPERGRPTRGGSPEVQQPRDRGRVRLPHHRLRQGHRRHRLRCDPSGAVLPGRLLHHRDLRLPLLPERQAHPYRRRLLADRGHLAAGSGDPARLRHRPDVDPRAVPDLRHRCESRRADGERLPGRGLRGCRPAWRPPGSASGRLIIPGGIALLSDTIGFITIMLIKIRMIQEMAITASLGVAVIILTNLVLVPVLLSYVNLGEEIRGQAADTGRQRWIRFWNALGKVAAPRNAAIIVIVAAVLFVVGGWKATQIKIGDLHPGVPELRADSQYNIDTDVITRHFSIGVDVITVIVESDPEACTEHDIMTTIDRFEWHMRNVPGVQSVLGIGGVAKIINAGWNEGSLKWRVLPRNPSTMAQAVTYIDTSTGLLNSDCSVMPVYIYSQRSQGRDHRPHRRRGQGLPRPSTAPTRSGSGSPPATSVSWRPPTRRSPRPSSRC